MEICPQRLSGYSHYSTGAGTEQFANSPEDARKKTLELLSQYPKGKLDAIHVACWDQPAIGIVQALEETDRDKDVKVTAIDAGPETLEIMVEPGSPFVANVAQQPHLIVPDLRR